MISPHSEAKEILKRRFGYISYSDSYLNTWTKESLIKLIRSLEINWACESNLALSNMELINQLLNKEKQDED